MLESYPGGVHSEKDTDGREETEQEVGQFKENSKKM